MWNLAKQYYEYELMYHHQGFYTQENYKRVKTFFDGLKKNVPRYKLRARMRVCAIMNNFNICWCIFGMTTTFVSLALSFDLPDILYWIVLISTMVFFGSLLITCGFGVKKWFMKYVSLRRTEIQIAVNKFNNRASVQETGLNLVLAQHGMVIWLCSITLQKGTEPGHGGDLTLDQDPDSYIPSGADPYADCPLPPITLINGKPSKDSNKINNDIKVSIYEKNNEQPDLNCKIIGEQAFKVSEKMKSSLEFAVGISIPRIAKLPLRIFGIFVGWQFQEILSQIFYYRNRQEGIPKK
jgi:hypothetical protein